MKAYSITLEAILEPCFWSEELWQIPLYEFSELQDDMVFDISENNPLNSWVAYCIPIMK